MSSNIGVCLDALNPTGRPTPFDLAGVNTVRLVARADKAMYKYHNDLRNYGFDTAVVLARESFGVRVTASRLRIYARNMKPRYWILGNEQDAYLLDEPSPSSWKMTPKQYAAFVFLCMSVLGPSVLLVGGGLVSGQPSWFDSYRGPQLYAWDIHPYGKTADETKDLIIAYRPYINNINISMIPIPLIMEWNRPVEEIKGYQAMLDDETLRSAWFCWSDGMVDGMGLVDSGGQAKEEYNALLGG